METEVSGPPSLSVVAGGYEVVDLSLTLDELLPCAWTGNMHFEHQIENWYVPLQGDDQPQRLRSVGPYYTCWMTIHEHTGTHFDAPTHYVPPPDSGLPYASEYGSMYGDHIPVRQFQGPAAVIDVTQLKGSNPEDVSPRITLERLHAWEAEHGEIEAGDAVILATGWDENYVPWPNGIRHSIKLPTWISPDAETVTYLADRGVELLGTDAPTIGAMDEMHSAHRAGLGRGMVYVEHLANVVGLPARGCHFIFLPLKITRSSGSPGRAIAFVPKPA
jgi:kynurenine formamidase